MSERRYIDFTPPTLSKLEKRALATKRLRIQRRGRANPVSGKELSKIAANYDGPILRLPPGFHRGFMPSFLRPITVRGAILFHRGFRHVGSRPTD